MADHLSHPAGDDRLQQISHRLMRATRRPLTFDIFGSHRRAVDQFHDHAASDVEWLIEELKTWRARAERAVPLVEVRGEDGSVWVRVDGLRVPPVTRWEIADG